MRAILPAILAFAVICAGAAVRTSRADAAADEMKKLQGTWIIIGESTQGHDRPMTRPSDSQTVVISGDEMKIYELLSNGKTELNTEYKIRVDATSAPASIDLIVEKHIGRGVYKLEGDKLLLCLPASRSDENRPAEVAPGKTVELLTMKRAAANAAPAGTEKTGDLPANSIGMKFASIPAGEFDMGSPVTEADRGANETLHHVKITKPFLMATTTVTQGQWKAIMGDNPSRWHWKDESPVEQVTWIEATAFCEKLSAKEGKHYRLPTEAEWEYACRAGTQTPYGGTGNLEEMGWYANNSGTRPIDSVELFKTDPKDYGTKLNLNMNVPHPGAMKKPNAWGLYDMHGNVFQWCSDAIGDYGGDAVDPTNSKAANDESARVVRGGAWGVTPPFCRSAQRFQCVPNGRSDAIGFRVCLDQEEKKAAAPAENPQYGYWTKFRPGSSVTMSGEMDADGQKMILKMKATLLDVAPEGVTLEKVISVTIGGQENAQPAKKEVVSSVASGENPKEIGDDEITIAGKVLKCKLYEVQTPVGGGKTTPTMVWVSDAVPGGAVKMIVKNPKGSVTFTVKEYEAK